MRIGQSCMTSTPWWKDITEWTDLGLASATDMAGHDSAFRANSTDR